MVWNLYACSTLDAEAARLCVSVEQLGLDILQTCSFLDGNNTGWGLAELKHKELPVYFMDDESRAVWRDIMFYAEGSRKRDFSGWGVRRNPHPWQFVLGERFGWGSPAGEQLYAQAWDEAHIEYENRRPKRKRETFTGGRYEDYTTQQIAYRRAVATIMSQRYYRRYLQSGRLRDSAWQYLVNVFGNDADYFRRELEYRTKADPEPRRSKKKTEEARNDFRQAQKYLDAGQTDYFFSPAFVEQAIEMEGEPDLTVDFEHLPRMPLAETPVRWMTQGQLVNDFMRWCMEITDTSSFEWEDKELILKNLRAMYARARGQKPDDGETIIGGKEESV